MNLLKSPWLPALLADGRQVNLRLQDIPASGAVAVAHPRGDFSALALELVIDLFQTVASPANQDQLDDWLSGELPDLTEAIETWAPAFELFGDRPFMQLPPASKAPKKGAKAKVDASDDDDEETGATPVPAGRLLYEAPGTQTLARRTDFFVRAHHYQVMCPRCAALGLYLNQAHACSAGNGYFTGPRAGSALAAIIEGPTLWETVCLNLLPETKFAADTVASAPDLLPWRNPAGLMVKGSFRKATDFGKYGVLWWSPRTIELYPESNEQQQPCDICGEVHAVHVPRVTKGAIKARLVAGTRHPRTAWRADKGETGGPVEVPATSFNAEAWQSLLLAEAVENALPAYGALTGSQRESVSLRTFGFCMDNASPLRWMDEITPVVFPVKPEYRPAMRDALVKAVKHVDTATKALGSALYCPKPNKVSSTNPVFPFALRAPQAKQELWLQMGHPILEMLRCAGAGQGTQEAIDAVPSAARRIALQLFNQATAPLMAEPRYARLLINRKSTLLQRLSPKADKPKNRSKKQNATSGSTSA